MFLTVLELTLLDRKLPAKPPLSLVQENTTSLVVSPPRTPPPLVGHMKWSRLPEGPTPKWSQLPKKGFARRSNTCKFNQYLHLYVQ